jgi:glyoxylase-like metal-dependent hydrolase (beta-lactamase superfamily II)
MDSVIEGLYASTPQPLPFAPSSFMRSFLCRREAGNLLVYSAGQLESDAQAIDELGGIARRYVNHGHEAEFVSELLEGPLYVNQRDAAVVAQQVPVDATFSDRHTVGTDFEVIPTPGHTPGATTYLWETGERRLLFTGDSLYLSEGEWVAAVLDTSNRQDYIASLELIRELEFDVLVPWNATGGQPYLVETDTSDRKRRLDAILARVARGESR